MIPYIDVPFEFVGQLAGASTDEIKLISSFLFSYPLAAILKRIPDKKPQLKNIFIISVAAFYLVGLFDLWTGALTLLVSAGGAYAIAKYVEGPLMPWVGFAFLMGHMSVSHIYRQIAAAPSSVDITGAQMVMVMKLTAFCWNVHDGKLPAKDLVDFQRERAIQTLPGLLDYAAYVLFFPSLFAGPAFDYVDYEQWIKTTMFDIPPGTDPAQAPRTRKKRRIPRSGTPATMKALQGIFWIALFIQFGAWYNVDLVMGDEFTKYNFIRRVWILEMLGFSTRLKYYGVWMLTEGACILSGLGYKGIDPKTGKVSWDRLQNVNPIGIETAQNPRAYLENWNMNTNSWLRNYVYLRVTPKGRKPGFRASMATFTTSAFWHGFYPGYYLSFMFAAFIQTSAKSFRRFVRPFFLTPDGQRPNKFKPYYDITTYFFTQIIFCFTTVPFVVLTLQGSMLVWSRVYFYAILLVAAAMAFFASPAKVILIKKLKQRAQPKPTPVAVPAAANGAIAVPSLNAEKAAAAADADGSAGATTTALNEKALPADLTRTSSAESLNRHPVLGMPDDPAREVENALREIQAEIEARQRRGSLVTMPTAAQLAQEAVDRLQKKE